MLPILLLLTAAAPSSEPIWPANAVVLVVAGWCAPCHLEVAGLDAIAEAAGDRRVQVVGIDQTAGTSALLARVAEKWRWQLSPTGQRTLREAVYAASAGLPYAVATDARGAVCAEFKMGLDAARTRALVARCKQ